MSPETRDTLLKIFKREQDSVDRDRGSIRYLAVCYRNSMPAEQGEAEIRALIDARQAAINAAAAEICLTLPGENAICQPE